MRPIAVKCSACHKSCELFNLRDTVVTSVIPTRQGTDAEVLVLVEATQASCLDCLDSFVIYTPKEPLK